MWTYGNIRIFAQTDTDTVGQIIPRIQPLSGATVLQIFGHESAIKSMSAVVVGSGDVEHLKTLPSSGVAFSLVGPDGTIGDYYPKSVNSARQMSVYQTIRGDLACTSPVYTVDLELYEA